MSAHHIYIIEDEKLLGSHLKRLLELSGYQATVFLNAEEFILSFSKVKVPAYFLIDLGLPGLKGNELVKLIRFKDKLSPIFVLSGSTISADMTACLDSGADDFLIKPFNHDHLLLKLKTAQTRLTTLIDKNFHEGIRLIPEGYLIMKDDLKVKLTKREFVIMERLINQLDITHTREELTNLDGPGETNDRSIDVHISSVRKKIKSLKLEIQTSRGLGYKISFT